MLVLTVLFYSKLSDKSICEHQQARAATILTKSPVSSLLQSAQKKKKIAQRQLRFVARQLIPFRHFEPARIYPDSANT